MILGPNIFIQVKKNAGCLLPTLLYDQLGLHHDLHVHSAALACAASWCPMQDPSKWGGAIELSILSRHLGQEIAAFDIQTQRVDIYGQDAGHSERVMLIYDGEPASRRGSRGRAGFLRLAGKLVTCSTPTSTIAKEGAANPLLACGPCTLAERSLCCLCVCHICSGACLPCR